MRHEPSKQQPADSDQNSMRLYHGCEPRFDRSRPNLSVYSLNCSRRRIGGPPSLSSD